MPRPFMVPDGIISRGTYVETQDEKREATAHATAEMATPSAASVRTIRGRDAPSDCRTAVSRCRTAARPKSRFATFAHTMLNVKPVTTEKIARNCGAPCDKPPFIVAVYGIGRTILFLFIRGYADWMRAEIVANSACDSAKETPGLSWPSIMKPKPPALLSSRSCCLPRARKYLTAGTQTSSGAPS